jgi:hypothetical protein
MSPHHHFYWRDLQPMLLEKGRYNDVREIEEIGAQMLALEKKRRTRMQELLKEVVHDHQTGAQKMKFRPTHARRLDTLNVETEFWFV